MTSRKLRTFEEKVNDFLRRREAGTWMDRNFPIKYPYMSEEEIQTVLRTCREIHNTAYDLAKQEIDESLLGQVSPRGTFAALHESMRTTLLEKYPYLEPKRLDRVIAHAINFVIR